MNLDELLNGILQQYQDDTDLIMGLSFLRVPFADHFRALAGLGEDVDYIQAFEAFMGIAHRTFRWNDYLEARTTAEETFRLFYARMGYPEDRLEEALRGFVISFFNQCIDEQQFVWEDEHPGQEMPEVAEGDVHTLMMARVLSVIPGTAEIVSFCQSMGVRYHYEQLHMCCWFSSQITKGAGAYTRDGANYSARTTYNRLLNPDSLLWIGAVLGADRGALLAAAEEMKSLKTNAAKCGTVRRYVPFDTIYQLYQQKMTDE